MGTDLKTIQRTMARKTNLWSRRIRFLPQLAENECGAACLAMILNALGRNVTVAEISRCCRVGRAGLTAATLTEVSSRYGVHLKVFSALAAAMRNIKAPAILHWEFGHWVVQEKWKKNYAIIVDPGSGRKKITPERFSESFTGVVLAVDSVDDWQKRSGIAVQRMFGKFLFKTILKSSVLLLGLLVLSAALIGQILGLFSAYASKLLLDGILPSRLKSLMFLLSLAGIGLIASRMSTEYIRAAVLTCIRKRLDAKLMPGLIEHLLELPFSFFQTRPTGDLLARLNSYPNLRQVVSDHAVLGFIDALFVIVYIIALGFADIREVPIVVGLATIQCAMVILRHRRLSSFTHQELEATADQQSALVDILRGIQHLKATGREAFAFAYWRSLFNRQLNSQSSLNYATAIIDSVLEAVRTATPLVLMWYGAIEVLAGRLSIGMMFAAMFWAVSVMTPILSIISSTQNLQYVVAYTDRLEDILASEPERKNSGAGIRRRLKGAIEIRNVSFQYPGDDTFVLRDINISLRAGEKLAVVGRTGAGKSTLLMLLLGIYKPTVGEILVDGVPLQDWDLQSFRCQIGTVLQDDTLFGGTVWANLTLGVPHAAIEDVVAAAQIARIHDDIKDLPLGYETYVSENGRNFSGGQRQRLTLARALVTKPNMLLLDEATSHIDPHTEAAIDRALTSLSCTRIVVAHRLSTVVNADHILVLEKGSILEQGTHQELINAAGTYMEIQTSMR